METPGYLQELFVSFQGEGTHVGRRHVFVRMAGCSLRCRFCDTPAALVRTEEVSVEQASGERVRVANPVQVGRVGEWVAALDPRGRAAVSLTGGEPLEQVEFLAALIPHLGGRTIYLETAGVHAEEMRRLRPQVNIVALDLKLDSVAHEGDRRAEHAAFLEASRGPERLAKIILSEAADLDELRRHVELLAGEPDHLPLILQPETSRSTHRPEMRASLLSRAYAVASELLDDVRVIPQTHRFLELP